MPFELVPRDTPLFDVVPESAVRAWILERKSLPLRTLPGMKEDRWADYHLDDIQSLHQKSGAITLYDPAAPCLLMARRLDWDTRILGVPSISLHHFFFSNETDTKTVVDLLNTASKQWRDEGLRLLVHKTSPANFGVIAAMAPCGFDLLCNHLDYLSDAERAAQISKPIDGYDFGPARPDEEEQVAQLTQNNYALTDRFNLDPMVPRDRIPAVYYEWGRNAFHGHSDLVWVARRGGKVVGITFWSDRKRLETITGVNCALNQLGAVDSRDAGHGVFRRMTATVIEYLHERGARWGTIATNVLNYPLQRSVQGIGCAIHDSLFTFRKDLQRD
jgi:hypothetical protein